MIRYTKQGIIILCVIFLLCSNMNPLSGEERSPVPGKVLEWLDQWDIDYIVYIKKSAFLLSVFNRDFEIIQSFPIAYGSNPDMQAKLYSGDGRTPEGFYYITQISHENLNHDSEEYKKLVRMNTIYYKWQDGYHKYGQPKKDLGSGVFGSGFFRLSYPNQNDIQRHHTACIAGKIPKRPDGSCVGPGSGIAIHGNNDPDSIGHLVSTGCVRMYNNDILVLAKYIDYRTPVIIAY